MNRFQISHTHAGTVHKQRRCKVNRRYFEWCDGDDDMQIMSINLLERISGAIRSFTFIGQLIDPFRCRGRRILRIKQTRKCEAIKWMESLPFFAFKAKALICAYVKRKWNIFDSCVNNGRCCQILTIKRVYCAYSVQYNPLIRISLRTKGENQFHHNDANASAFVMRIK